MKQYILFLIVSLFFISLNANYNETIFEPWGVDSELARISHQLSEQIAPLLPQIASQHGEDSVHETRTRHAGEQDGVTRCASCQRAGKKCGLAHCTRNNVQIHNVKAHVGQSVCKGMIRFFQVYISPIDGPRSSFYPTSSQYALDAIQKYGVFQGIALGCDRLLRENSESWVYERTDKYGIERKVDHVR